VVVALSCCVVSAQTITEISPLQFGTVYPGIPKTIARTTAGAAAEYHVSGVAGTRVRITFLIVPTYMNFGAFNMHLVISDTAVAMDTSLTPNQSSPDTTRVSPWQPVEFTLGSGGLTLWFGGVVVPGLAQKSGSYSAVIQIHVQAI
jgi:hypothetical protein